MRRTSIVLLVVLWPVAALAQRSDIALPTHAPIPTTMDVAVSGASNISAPKTDIGSLPLYYARRTGATVYASADFTTPYLQLSFHEPVFLVSTSGAWYEIRTEDGGHGYVLEREISNIWIRVSKSEKTVFVYEGTSLVSRIPADLAYNFFSDKSRQGSTVQPDHWRTPEGRFYVVSKNANSKFYKALVLNYPSPEDADRGLEQGLITKRQHRAIVAANARQLPPPMGTALGGMIEIHGQGTGARTSWTQGCVAVHNKEMDYLWDIVTVGTPVMIEP